MGSTRGNEQPGNPVPGLPEATMREIIRIGTELAEMMLGDPDAAEDIAQLVVIDVWEDVLEDPGGFDPLKPLEPFVYARVANKVVDMVRSANSREGPHFEYEWTREASANAAGYAEAKVREEDLAKVIDRVLRKTPPRRREIWLRIRQDKESYEMVARAYGLSIKTLENHVTNVQNAIMRAVIAHMEDR
jgi:RNA polymerase sigma-70 factor (ECF subfamily)